MGRREKIFCSLLLGIWDQIGPHFWAHPAASKTSPPCLISKLRIQKLSPRMGPHLGPPGATFFEQKARIKRAWGHHSHSHKVVICSSPDILVPSSPKCCTRPIPKYRIRNRVATSQQDSEAPMVYYIQLCSTLNMSLFGPTKRAVKKQIPPRTKEKFA